jgi:hypothetical protein
VEGLSNWVVRDHRQLKRVDNLDEVLRVVPRAPLHRAQRVLQQLQRHAALVRGYGARADGTHGWLANLGGGAPSAAVRRPYGRLAARRRAGCRGRRLACLNLVNHGQHQLLGVILLGGQPRQVLEGRRVELDAAGLEVLLHELLGHS